MSTVQTRRKFLDLLQRLAVVPVLPGMGSFASYVQAVPHTPTTAPTSSKTLLSTPWRPALPGQAMQQFVNDAITSVDSATLENFQHAQISEQQGPAIPYVPGSDGSEEEQLDGATHEDFPADYTIFDPQTGLFGEEGEAGLPVGF
jgi:hypothetical protein